jgi:MYXO-CTERM domain-containing protein
VFLFVQFPSTTATTTRVCFILPQFVYRSPLHYYCSFQDIINMVPTYLIPFIAVVVFTTTIVCAAKVSFSSCIPDSSTGHVIMKAKKRQVAGGCRFVRFRIRSLIHVSYIYLVILLEAQSTNRVISWPFFLLHVAGLFRRRRRRRLPQRYYTMQRPTAMFFLDKHGKSRNFVAP